MTVAGVHWSWIYWVLTIFSFICLVVILAAVPETYGPLLLSHKAKRLRAETGQPWWAPLERKKSGIKARLSQTLVGPFKMLAEEPMLLSITLYMSYVVSSHVTWSPKRFALTPPSLPQLHLRRPLPRLRRLPDRASLFVVPRQSTPPPPR